MKAQWQTPNEKGVIVRHVNDAMDYRIGIFRFTEHQGLAHWIIFDKTDGKLRDLKYANRTV